MKAWVLLKENYIAGTGVNPFLAEIHSSPPFSSDVESQRKRSVANGCLFTDSIQIFFFWGGVANFGCMPIP